MRYYRVTNRATRETHDVLAESAAAACRFLGWMIGHCYVEDLSHKRSQALKDLQQATRDFVAAGSQPSTDPPTLDDLDRAVRTAAHRALHLGCTMEQVTDAQIAAIQVQPQEAT